MTTPSLGRLALTDEADLEQAHAAPDVIAEVITSGAAVNSETSPSTPADGSPPTLGGVRSTPKLDFFVRDSRGVFAGRHLIVDLWGAQALDDVEGVEAALIRAAEEAGATVLGADFHHFQPNGGVTGVVVLAESHISIHTWPEASFAAVDVFMCGDAEPQRTVPVLRAAFSPERLSVQELRRGVVRARG